MHGETLKLGRNLFTIGGKQFEIKTTEGTDENCVNLVLFYIISTMLWWHIRQDESKGKTTVQGPQTELAICTSEDH